MTAKHTPKLTGEQIKAHLTQEELERIDHDRPQMTYATTQFIESLVEERIQKVALLAACKWACAILDGYEPPIDGEPLKHYNKGYKTLQSAVSQAGESGE